MTEPMPVTVVSGRGGNIRTVLAAARKLVGLELKHSREVLRSGGEDGLYRVHLSDGTIVEVTIAQRCRTEVHLSELQG